MNKDAVYILSIYIYSYTHTMEYYSVIEMNEILPFAAMWLHLEGTVQGKISQTEKNKYHMILLIYLKTKQTNQHNKTETESQIQRGEVWGGGK